VVIDTLEELPGWAVALLEHERVARLGIVDSDNEPRVMPVTYAACAGALWSIVDQKPKREGELARVRWLRRHPRAALTVDHYSDDWAKLAWVQLLGPVAILRASDHPDAVTALTGRYPQYVDDPPPGPLLRLTPDRILLWRAALGG
jgi:PPOX class probable F420-dependent enzyme